ncbi:hypothetical protein [Actinomadura gamaensis]|uniref:Uncharacterized protein n=1 Tax=Actinomadura gamaensis TaxID=1763541 RepID=A0ABV9U1U9_9ACTN
MGSLELTHGAVLDGLCAASPVLALTVLAVAAVARGLILAPVSRRAFAAALAAGVLTSVGVGMLLGVVLVWSGSRNRRGAGESLAALMLGALGGAGVCLGYCLVAPALVVWPADATFGRLLMRFLSVVLALSVAGAASALLGRRLSSWTQPFLTLIGWLLLVLALGDAATISLLVAGAVGVLAAGGTARARYQRACRATLERWVADAVIGKDDHRLLLHPRRRREAEARTAGLQARTLVRERHRACLERLSAELSANPSR